MNERILARLRALMELAAQENLQELQLEVGDSKFVLRRGQAQLPAAAPVQAPQGLPLRSPLAGIFYRAPETGAQPLVREGDWVEQGQTVALVEAMKVFNEIAAPVAGRVAAVKAADGQLVAEGEVLMLLAPAAGGR